MGGKKKKAGGSGGKDGEEEDVSVDNFVKAYRKKCAELGCEVSKIIKEKYETYQEEGDPIDKVSEDRYNCSKVPLLGGARLARSARYHRLAQTSQVSNESANEEVATHMLRPCACGRLSARTRA